MKKVNIFLFLLLFSTLFFYNFKVLTVSSATPTGIEINDSNASCLASCAKGDTQCEQNCGVAQGNTQNNASGPSAASIKYGLSGIASGSGLPHTGTLPERIGAIVGAALSLIGVLFFLLMVYGGFLWMTARGDEAQLKKGQQIIVDAVLGMAAVAASYLIANFIFTMVK